jgi:hypothetical protein
VNWLLQVPQSLFNFLPWAVLLPLAWSRVVTDQWPALGRRGLWLKGLRAGLVVGFLVIALLPSSRPRFMVPLNTAAALLVVACFALLPAAARWRWVRGWLLVLVGVGAAGGLGGLVGAGWFADRIDFNWAVIVVAAVVGVLVPAAVIELDEAHAGLAESAGEQALAAEVGGFAGAGGVAFADLVALEGGGGFLAEIEQAGGDGLHAEAEFQGLDDAFELAVLRVVAPVVAIHCLNEIELAAFDGLGEVAAGDVGQGGAGHVLAVDADGGAGVDGGQTGAGVLGGLGGVEADEPG